MKVRHAELGVDGDHAFALLGENIQEGECEFEPIVEMDWTNCDPVDRASRIAFNRLRARLDPDRVWLTYYLGPSHPRGR